MNLGLFVMSAFGIYVQRNGRSSNSELFSFMFAFKFKLMLISEQLVRESSPSLKIPNFKFQVLVTRPVLP